MTIHRPCLEISSDELTFLPQRDFCNDVNTIMINTIVRMHFIQKKVFLFVNDMRITIHRPCITDDKRNFDLPALCIVKRRYFLQ